jgi:hypothetical protein
MLRDAHRDQHQGTSSPGRESQKIVTAILHILKHILSRSNTALTSEMDCPQLPDKTRNVPKTAFLYIPAAPAFLYSSNEWTCPFKASSLLLSSSSHLSSSWVSVAWKALA